MTAPYLLSDPNNIQFPDVELALTEPDGLLAVGGDLSVARLKNAYQHGVFPWYSDDQPILWWSPDPRMVLPPENIKISRSLAKTIRQNKFKVTFDTNFQRVITACSEPRLHQDGTWIIDEMIEAYISFHEAGYAHSVECWLGDELVGGLYGIAIGKVFFGESMFSRVTDASKIAFVYLARQLQRRGFVLIDCQVYTSHLESLGATLIPRKTFIQMLNNYALDELADKNQNSKWIFDDDIQQFVLQNK